MKIALIQLPHFYGEGLSRPPDCYPLGLGYIASTLKQKGFEYEAFDFWMSEAKPENAAEVTAKSNCDIFGISAYSTQYSYLKEFSQKLKKLMPNIPQVSGGAGATFNPEIILKNTGVNICVIGEGEETIIDLLLHMNDPGFVKGIVYKNDKGEIRQTEARPQIRDLSNIPECDRELFNQEQYIKNLAKDDVSQGMRGTNLISARGCPYSCNFCSKTFKEGRFRPVDDIIKEVKDLKERYKLGYVAFNDELLVVNKKRTEELCRKIKELDVKWICQGRINTVDEEILSQMKDSGCFKIGYGVESISQDILDKMNKRIKADKVVSVIEMTRKMGIEPIVQYMYGYPGENNETIKETEEFFKRIDHPYMGSLTTPLPGSPLYDDSVKKGFIKNEEEYLLNLDSGYNGDRILVNLTEFSNDELLSKRITLRNRVNANYFDRHPLKKVLLYCDKLIRGFKLIFQNPKHLLRKVKAKFA